MCASPRSRAVTAGTWSRIIARSATSTAKPNRALDAVGLLGKAAELASNLSHGEQRNLEIGIALATEPKLLCLDEPTAGMSQGETDETTELIRRIGKNLTILIVEHDMQIVMQIAIALPCCITAQFSPKARREIQDNPRVLEVYLKT